MSRWTRMKNLTAWPPYSCPSRRWRSLWLFRSNTCNSGSRKNWKANSNKLHRIPIFSYHVPLFSWPARRCSQQSFINCGKYVYFHMTYHFFLDLGDDEIGRHCESGYFIFSLEVWHLPDPDLMNLYRKEQKRRIQMIEIYITTGHAGEKATKLKGLLLALLGCWGRPDSKHFSIRPQLKLK